MHSLFNIDDSRLPPVTRCYVKPGDKGILPCGELKGKFSVKDDGKMLVKVTTCNKDLNDIIGNEWYINHNTLPNILISVNKTVENVPMTIWVTNKQYYISIDGCYTGRYDNYSFSHRILEMVSSSLNVSTTRCISFNYNGLQFDMSFDDSDTLVDDIILVYNNHILFRLNELFEAPTNTDIIFDSITDIIGKYLTSEYLRDGKIVKSHYLTSHEFADMKEEIYWLIMQRLSHSMKSATKK